MEELIPIGAILIAATVGITAVLRTRREWTRAAERLGIHHHQGFGVTRRMLGHIAGHRIRVEAGRVGGKRDITRFELTSNELPGDVTLASPSLWTELKTILSGQELNIGDPVFDRAVTASGPEESVRAVLGAEARKLATAFVSGMGGSLSAGVMRVDLQGSGPAADRIVRTVNLMVELGTEVRCGPGLVPRRERLANLATWDPESLVRQACLQLLVTAHGDAAETRSAVKRALSDPSPELRLLAASAVDDDEANAVAANLARDDALPPVVRARALAIVAARQTGATREAFLREAIASEVPALACRAATLLGHSDDRWALELIQERLGAKPDERLTAEMVRALGRIGEAGEADALVELLTALSPEVRVAAAESLGRIGALHHVERLLPHTRGLTTPSTVKEAARSAIREIQSRHGGSSGQLSMLRSNEALGALSAPPAEPGALAMHPNDDD